MSGREATQGPSIFAQIREALTGTEQDFTQGSLNRAILLLGVPMIIEMSMEALFAIVDMYFVAHLGAYAAATVQLTEGLLVFVYALGMGLAMGTTAVVARRTGEQNPEAVARSAWQAVIIAVVLGILLVSVGVPMAPQLLDWMGADSEVQLKGTAFTRLSLASSGVILLLFLMNAIFRGSGDAAIAMRVLILANGINVLLVPCLVNGWGPFPQMGVTGSALGTLIGRSAGVVYQIWLLFHAGHRVCIRRHHMRLDLPAMGTILRLSGIVILQSLIQTASWTFMIKLMSRFGSAANAGYGIAIRIIIFSVLPSWGLGGAAATLVGQNLGAKQPDRAEAAVWRACWFNAAFLALVSIAFIGFPDALMRIFIQEPRVVEIGSACLRILAYDYVIFAFGMVLVQAFNGAGDSVTPTLINLFVYWGFQVPLAYWLADHTTLGPNSVFWAVMVSEAVLTLVAVLVFRMGRWKKAVV